MHQILRFFYGKLATLNENVRDMSMFDCTLKNTMLYLERQFCMLYIRKKEIQYCQILYFLVYKMNFLTFKMQLKNEVSYTMKVL